jgi:hypothetical protein
MFELLCPQHGIPAYIGILLGLDPGILYLTFQMYYARLSQLVKF